MPNALLAALQRLALLKGYTNPNTILAAAEARKRPKPVLYWTKENT